MKPDASKKRDTMERAGLNDLELQDILRGKTFQVYWYLLSQGEAGPRELQRKLGFSSPNISVHHLRKLVNADLVSQNPVHNKYEIKREVRTGVLSLYTRLGRYLIPQNLFLLTFYSSITLCYLFLIMFPRGTIIPEDILFLIVAVIGMAFFIQQTQKIWRLRPF
ncbi:MAG: ArsR family transcriptional regulator [Candidatus Heimdallarchaeota archaeon]